jgi:hypothetical protein
LLEETEREIITEAHGEVGTTARGAPDVGHGKALVASENEDATSSVGGSGGSVADDASGDESSLTYFFGASTITLDRI